MMPLTGVFSVPGWSVKAWRSRSQRWYVQIERKCPERGGWIRGWLTSSHSGIPQTFPTLNAALAAAAAFCATPQIAAWCENHGIV